MHATTRVAQDERLIETSLGSRERVHHQRLDAKCVVVLDRCAPDLAATSTREREKVWSGARIQRSGSGPRASKRKAKGLSCQSTNIARSTHQSISTPTSPRAHPPKTVTLKDFSVHSGQPVRAVAMSGECLFDGPPRRPERAQLNLELTRQPRHTS